MSLLRASLFFKRKFSASLPSILPANSNLYNTNFQRTHLMGELSESLLQKQVTLCGWVSTIRNVSKNLFFLLLRDHSGTVQLTLTRTHIAEETFLALQEAVEKRKVTPEAVIAVRGIVQPRPIGMNNSAMTNGSIEIFVQDFRILNTIQNQTSSSKQLPFTLNDKYLPTEDVRLQDRFLDLRRDDMQKVIRFRAKVNRSIRSFFDSQGNDEYFMNFT
jgi:aspartyl-tRNA synthetase